MDDHQVSARNLSLLPGPLRAPPTWSGIPALMNALARFRCAATSGQTGIYGRLQALDVLGTVNPSTCSRFATDIATQHPTRVERATTLSCIPGRHVVTEQPVPPSRQHRNDIDMEVQQSEIS